MKSRLMWVLVLVWLIGIYGVATADGPSLEVGAARIEPSTIDAFKAALIQDGFTVREWAYGKVDVAQLVCSKQIQSGYGNNAGGSYLAITWNIPGLPNVPRKFQLEPTDAIVIIGNTPPPVAYFSYRTYLFSHNYDGQSDPKLIFASLGDTLNNMTANTGETVSESPYNRPIMVVSTPDKGIDARVRSAAMSAGISPAIMNTDVIPSSVVKLGKEKSDDTLVFLNRMSVPAYGHEQELEAYMQDPGMKVFHLSQKVTPTADPFPTPVLRVRGTGMTEADLMPSLEELRKAILGRHPGYTATELTTKVWINEWLDGIQRKMNVIGETRDTSYLCTSQNFTLADDADEFLIIYGVNHQATGKATYASFSVYQKETDLGVKGLNSPAFGGSAANYIPQDQNAPYLYAWKVARNCGKDPKCLKIELPDSLLPCTPVDLNGELFVGFRAYLEPGTAVGPAPSELLYDQVIVFKKSK